ncbi:MAG: YlzJ-like family protein [Eubacteriales bacterium]
MSIIYTPLPIELVLEGIEKDGQPYQELDVGGVKLLVEQQTMDKCRVVRVLSTNPMDYLKAEFQPGTELKFVPQFSPQAPEEGHLT